MALSPAFQDRFEEIRSQQHRAIDDQMNALLALFRLELSAQQTATRFHHHQSEALNLTTTQRGGPNGTTSSLSYSPHSDAFEHVISSYSRSDLPASTTISAALPLTPNATPENTQQNAPPLDFSTPAAIKEEESEPVRTLGSGENVVSNSPVPIKQEDCENGSTRSGPAFEDSDIIDLAEDDFESDCDCDRCQTILIDDDDEDEEEEFEVIDQVVQVKEEILEEAEQQMDSGETSKQMDVEQQSEARSEEPAVPTSSVEIKSEPIWIRAPLPANSKRTVLKTEIVEEEGAVVDEDDEIILIAETPCKRPRLEGSPGTGQVKAEQEETEEVPTVPVAIQSEPVSSTISTPTTEPVTPSFEYSQNSAFQRVLPKAPTVLPPAVSEPIPNQPTESPQQGPLSTSPPVPTEPQHIRRSSSDQTAATKVKAKKTKVLPKKKSPRKSPRPEVSAVPKKSSKKTTVSPKNPPSLNGTASPRKITPKAKPTPPISSSNGSKSLTTKKSPTPTTTRPKSLISKKRPLPPPIRCIDPSNPPLIRPTTADPPAPPRAAPASSSLEAEDSWYSSHDIRILQMKCHQADCEKMFTSKTAHTAHMRDAHNKGPIICPQMSCISSFPNKSTYLQHVKVAHSGRTDWICRLCSKHFKSDNSLFGHWCMVHEAGQFQCARCSFVDRHRAQVSDHYAIEHLGKRPTSSSSLRRVNSIASDGAGTGTGHTFTAYWKACPIQECRYKCNGDESEHLERVHGILEQRCLVARCSTSYHTKKELQDHVEQAHSSGPLDCQDCTRSFTSYYELNWHHGETHTQRNGIYGCTTGNCQERTATLAEMEKHYNRYHLKKVLTISVTCFMNGCESKFHHEADLARHVRVDHDQLPEPCLFPGCSESFEAKDDLSHHLKLANHHAKEWTCTICHQRVFGPHASYHRHRVYNHFAGTFQCAFKGCDHLASFRKLIFQHFDEVHLPVLNGETITEEAEMPTGQLPYKTPAYTPMYPNVVPAFSVDPSDFLDYPPAHQVPYGGGGVVTRSAGFS